MLYGKALLHPSEHYPMRFPKIIRLWRTSVITPINGKVIKMKVQADNINGVYQVDDFVGTVLDQDDFYQSLATNKVDSVICADIDDAMCIRIDAEYGIN